MFINWVILIAAIVLLVLLARKAASTMSKGKENGFLVADRSLGPFVMAGTVVATGFSGWGFMGSPGAAYQYGTIELLGNFFFAPAMVVAVLFFAVYLRNRAVKMGSSTIPEFIVNLHCADRNSTTARVLRVVTALGMVIFLTVFLTAQIRALGMLGSSWLGISPMLASALLLIIITIYTMTGGLLAVAWTDTFMVIGMATAALYIVFQVFTDIPLSDMMTQLKAIDPNLVNPQTSAPYGDAKASVFLVFAYALIFSTALPYMSVRFLAMKSNISIAKTGLYTALLGCILSLVPIVGLYVRIKNPGLANPDEAMPWYLANAIPSLVGSVITLFILFAMKSTANSILHTLSTAASHDLRLAFFNHTGHSQSHLLKLNRLWVALVALIAFITTFFLPEAMLSYLGIFSSGTLMAALSGVLLVSIFYRGSAVAAIASIIVGAVCSSYLLTINVVGWVEGPLIGSAASAMTYIIISLIHPNKPALASAPITPA
ncbi:MAG: hypothetical protein Q4P13_07145 [Psychrobacter sp.]|nr:hypothetical protein [Psychrobacter sp.]